MLKFPRLARLVVTLALLAALAFLVEWDKVAAALMAVQPVWLLAAAGFVLAARATIALRWSLFLRVAGHRPPLRRLFSVVSAGIGLGSMLPTSIGPDLARGVLLKTRTGGAPAPDTGLVVASLLLDRLAATLGTLLVALAGAVSIGSWKLAAVFSAAVLAILCVTAVLVLKADWMAAALTRRPLDRLRPKFAALALHLSHPGVLRRAMLPAVLASMVMTAFRTGVFICLYAGFGHPVPVGLALLAIPVMLIALMAPVTVGGFGLREWLLVAGFTGAAIPAEISVSVGLTAFAVQMAVSLPWILPLLRPDAPVAGGRPERHPDKDLGA